MLFFRKLRLYLSNPPSILAAQADFKEIAAVISDDFYVEDWIRHDAAEILGIQGDFNEVTGDGSEVVCNVKTELAINQRQMCAGSCQH